ncbi:MAG: glycosyltransferase family 39 protein [Verrucomicrobia bacterium]|nr:glycosyltransferase family 39 protein [Verrucomicrobiota bacterium]
MRGDEERRSKGKSKKKPHLFIAVLLLVHLGICLLVLAKNVSRLDTSERLVSSDSVHYVEIARDFAAGDFSMQYVKERPHRQPLYPALLALALKLGNGNRFTLGAVNIVFAEMSILAVYASTLALFKHRLAAILSALALAANPFIDREITARLLTEPLHLFLTICAIFTFLRYMQRKDCRWLFACGGLLGLDYLTRPNGLIMAAAAVGTMALADLLNYCTAVQTRPSFFGWFIKMGGIYLVTVLIFFVVSAPSWVPRLIYFGNPFHHGYLENYMWVDSYKAGHVGESYPSYTWRDYLAHHHPRDIVSRLIHGFRYVYFRIPIFMERVPLLFLFSIGGVWIAFRIAPGEYRFLCLFLFLQTLPLVWTNLSNPTARVPYGSMLPFELFLAALFFAWISGRPRIRAWFVERFAPGDKPGGPPIARLPVQSRTTLLVKYFKGAGFSLRSPRNRFEILGCKTASLAS